jgi:hypothetical protein
MGTPAVTISPAFGSCATVSIALSISLASRTVADNTRTPNDGAAVSIMRERL